MLPFLKKKDGFVASSTPLTIHREPDQSSEQSEQKDMRGVELAMEDFCKALEQKDYKSMAEALRSAFDILDAQPHEEGPHLNESEE